MRFRQLQVRYASVLTRVELKPIGDPWGIDRKLPLASRHWRPPVDLYETSANWMVKVEIAGMNEENLEILLYQDTLVIEGQRPWEAGSDCVRFQAAEIHYGPFRVALPIPASICPDQVAARYDRGFLIVTLPKGDPRS